MPSFSKEWILRQINERFFNNFKYFIALMIGIIIFFYICIILFIDWWFN